MDGNGHQRGEPRYVTFAGADVRDAYANSKLPVPWKPGYKVLGLYEIPNARQIRLACLGVVDLRRARMMCETAGRGVSDWLPLANWHGDAERAMIDYYEARF